MAMCSTSGGASRSLTWMIGKAAQSAGHVHLDRLHPILEHRADPVTGTKSGAAQRVRQLARAFQQLAVGEHVGATHNGGPVCVALTGERQQFANGPARHPPPSG